MRPTSSSRQQLHGAQGSSLSAGSGSEASSGSSRTESPGAGLSLSDSRAIIKQKNIQILNTQKAKQILSSELDSTTSSSAAAGGAAKGGSKLKQFIIISLFVVGLLVCVSSLICLLLLPSFVTNQISKRLVLKNNSLLLERWSKPNVPMFFKVWVWDVQNAKEVLEKRGTKPILKELGPFVFNLKRQKDIVSFAGENLYYTERKIYHFNPELSCCSINTTVTIPNIPLIAVVDRALSYNLPLVGRFIPRLINRAIQSLREQLFVKKQVREILFDGYEVELLKMVSRVGSLVGLPQTQKKFALLKGRNDTWRPEQDGVWAINTGSRDRKMFGKVSSWNSYRQLPFWAQAGCNTINGSDGTLFPPPIKRSEPLYIFNQELCRTVNLVFDKPSDVHAIKAYRFVLNPMNFAHTMAPGSSQMSPLMSRPLMLGATGSVNPRPINQNSPDRAQQVSVGSGAALKPAASEPPETIVGASAASSGLSAIHQQNRAAASSGNGLSRSSSSFRPIDMSQPATPAEQQRLVQVAQENQAQLDRQSESKRNPFTCFCDRKGTNLNGVNVCEFDGLIELSKCTKQAQVIFGSMPHFFQSDPRLARQVSGMQPNASRHTTYLDIEPNTGLVLGGKRRVQLNIIIKHNNEVDGFENINDMLVPLVWFEESAMIPVESANKFKSLYTERIRMVNIVLSTLFLAALGLLAIDIRLLASHYGRCYRRFAMNKPGSREESFQHHHQRKGFQLAPGSSSPLSGSTKESDIMNEDDDDDDEEADDSDGYNVSRHNNAIGYHQRGNAFRQTDHAELTAGGQLKLAGISGLESPLLGGVGGVGGGYKRPASSELLDSDSTTNKSAEYALRSNATLMLHQPTQTTPTTANRSIINFDRNKTWIQQNQHQQQHPSTGIARQQLEERNVAAELQEVNGQRDL